MMYLYMANTFYYCYRSYMMAEYSGLAKSSLCDAGAQIIFVTLVAFREALQTYEHFQFFYFP